MLEKFSKAIQKCESAVRVLFQGIVSFVFAVIWTLAWLPMSFVYAFSPSYYPEKKRKNAIVRIFENVAWTLRYQRANKFYTLYGLDVSGASGSAYLDENSFWRGLKKMCADSVQGGVKQTYLLRDKFQFFRYMKANGLPTPEVFAFVKNGKFFDASMNKIDVSALSERKNYFLKAIDGECASFVKRIDDYDELQAQLPNIQKGMYILQEAAIQAEEMNKLNPHASNTLRIVTVYNNGDPYVMAALLRVGTSASGQVDNWAAGGLSIGINADGRLQEYGYYKPGHGLKANVHPDTGVKFSDFVVPHFDKAVQAACDAQRAFYNVGAIGWDIATTENGPMFIEGNDNFEISLHQASDGGLKQKWKDACSTVAR